MDYALARLWESWGVRPDAVLGHSVGEYAAACFAGVFSLEDGLRLIAERGRLMQALPRGGAMAAVLAPEERVAALVAPRPDRLADRRAQRAGQRRPVRRRGRRERGLARNWRRKAFAAQRLTVSHAFHSPLLDPMLDGLERAAGADRVSSSADRPCVQRHRPAFRGRRSARRRLLAEAQPRGGAFRGRHPGAGRARLRRLRRSGPGADSSRRWAANACRPARASGLPSLRKGQDDWACCWSGLASLFVHGVKVDWRGFDRPYARNRVPLPTYPFARERYWLETNRVAQARARAASWSRAAPAIRCSASGCRPRCPPPQFAAQWSLRKLPYLADHKVQGAVVAPGAAYLETALAAARDVFGEGAHDLENVTFSQPLFLSEGRPHAVELVLEAEASGRSPFQFFQAPADGDPKAAWTLHASGAVRRAWDDAPPRPWCADLGEVQSRCTEELDRPTCYRKIERARPGLRPRVPGHRLRLEAAGGGGGAGSACRNR